ncbi:hypothetical protein PMAYCL1PPCAC_00606, partial [Pristionchus mayeri]
PSGILYCLRNSFGLLFDTLHVEVGGLHRRVEGTELNRGQGVGGYSVGGDSVVMRWGGVGEVGTVLITITDPVVDLGDNSGVGNPFE